MVAMVSGSRLITIICFLIAVVLRVNASRDHAMEAKLIRDTFLNNNESRSWVLVRPPSPDTGDAVKVTLGVNAFKLLNVDERTGQMTATFFEHRSWTDERLTWGPDAYGGVEKISIPPSYIWTPDFQYMHDRGGQFERDNHPVYGAKLVVQSNGLVMHVPEVEVSFSCRFDLTWFPFDTQYCKIELLSWIHSKQELEAVIDPTMTAASHDLQHSDWNITNINLTSVDKMYSCCPETYQTIQIHLTLERKFGFYFYIFCFPSGLLTAVLPFIHLFPPGNNSKPLLGQAEYGFVMRHISTNTTYWFLLLYLLHPLYILAALVLVINCILHVLLYDHLQNFAEDLVPKLVLHYGMQMMMAVASIAWSSLTACLANTAHSTFRVPRVIRKFLGVVLGKVCCFGEADTKGEFSQIGMNIPFDRQNDMAPIVTDTAQPDEHQGHPSETALDRINAELQSHKQKQQIDREWYQVAIVLERLAFIVYMLIVIIYTAGLRAGAHKE